jgi:nitronate monooxygenase
MAINNIPSFKIGDLEVCGIQGGMGVGISRAGLASAMANEGFVGTIASVGLGALKGYFADFMRASEEDIRKASSDEEKKEIYDQLYALANQIALREEIKETRKRTNGVVAANIMHALSDYTSLVRAAIAENVDIIISGAGIPRDLPSYLYEGSRTKLVPIVSSARLAKMICDSWARQKHLPDAIVVEGPMAGGHLGYVRYNPAKPGEIDNLDNLQFVEQGLERIVREVFLITREIKKQYGVEIPVIAAGGLFYGGDIRKANEWGAAGVQIATRTVTTNECDADPKFKQAYIDCKKEDLVIINSPVGMPGRAIRNTFLDSVERGEKVPIACPYHCLKTCIPEKSPYCIANALTSALRGNFQSGYVFAGSSAWRCKEKGIVSVHQLVSDLDEEYARNVRSD